MLRTIIEENPSLQVIIDGKVVIGAKVVEDTKIGKAIVASTIDINDYAKHAIYYTKITEIKKLLFTMVPKIKELKWYESYTFAMMYELIQCKKEIDTLMEVIRPEPGGQDMCEDFYKDLNKAIERSKFLEDPKDLEEGEIIEDEDEPEVKDKPSSKLGVRVGRRRL